jgi:LPXTG-motif cell wall-anchored protein
MGLSLVLALCVAAALLAASPSIPRWMPWLVPAGTTVFFFIAWWREREPPATGDNQPGTLAIFGLASVSLVIASVVAGLFFSRRR